MKKQDKLAEKEFFDKHRKKHGSYKVFPDQEYRRIISYLFGEKHGMKVLSVGCGSGEFEKFIQNQGNSVVGIDISDELVKIARSQGIDAEICDVRSLCFKDGSFDACFCGAVLHHVPNEIEITLKEIHRVLKSEGKFLVFEPNMNLCNWVFLPLGRLWGTRTQNERPFVLKKFEKKVIKAGFDISKVVRLRNAVILENSFISSFIYKLSKLLFNHLPFVDKDEFFLTEAIKKS